LTLKLQAISKLICPLLRYKYWLNTHINGLTVGHTLPRDSIFGVRA